MVVKNKFLLFVNFREMIEVLNEVKFVTSRMYSDDRDELIACEWKFAATVLDK